MTTRLFLHDSANALTGTFPSGEQDAQTADFSAIDAGTLREMNAAIGASVVNKTAETVATASSQAGFVGMWCSKPLLAQTVGGAGQTLDVNVGDYSTNTLANFFVNRVHAYVWRPSTGANVGDLSTYATAPTGSPAEANANNIIMATLFSVPLAAVAAQDGDVIIVELWAQITQSAASSYTVGIRYDGSEIGTVENDIVSNYAAFVEFSQDLVFTAFAGNAAATATAAGGLTTAITLDGDAAATASAGGALNTSITMAGAAADTVTAGGNLTAAITLAGDAQAQSGAAAALKVVRPWMPLTISAPAMNLANLDADVTLLSVDPWTHGVSSGIGSHTQLSFPNAVAALVEQLTGLTGAGFGIGIGAESHEGLAAQLTTLAAAFPLPNFVRLARRATSMAGLENSKFNLVPPQRTRNTIDLSAIPTLRAIKRADLIKAAYDDAEAFKSSSPSGNLTAFAGERAAHAAMAASVQDDAKAGLSGGNGWRFYATDNLAWKLQLGHPGHDLPLTAIMLFVGPEADLQILKEIFP
jgi:hypothetical protein